MYQCRDCGSRFEDADVKIINKDCEKKICPLCSGWITPIQNTHCRYCGAKLPKGAQEYCNEYCRKNGNLMWEKERIRRKKDFESSMSLMQRLTGSYNLKYHTRYSYGQFVTLVYPRLTKEQLNEL